MSDPNLALIICTFNRPSSLSNLLENLTRQTLLPASLLVVDGSTNTDTSSMVEGFKHKLEISYYRVAETDRGLTRQRNFGVSRLPEHTRWVAFLDDDVILDPSYFYEINRSFNTSTNVVGVGGYVTNEVNWEFVGEVVKVRNTEFYLDGWKRREQSRMVLRKMLGLYPSAPGRQPMYSHALSVGYLPPSGKEYHVDFLMGCAMAFRKDVLDRIKFSQFFEGYGLYEDMDFSLRASREGELRVNTKASLQHYHAPSGRPNLLRYGRMVVRNGWYVWRVWNPTPRLMDTLKWWSITILLTVSRSLSVIKGPRRTDALIEVIGRIWGMIQVVFKSPRLAAYE